jgi:aminoglycoside phosphotransferase (APT) family kinase protein
VTCDPRQADGAELIGRAGRALERSWRRGVAVAEVLVSMPERCVFVAASPDGSQVVVKSDIRPGRLAAEREVLMAARAAGLPVPAIVHGGGGPLPLLVLEYVRGQALSSDSPALVWAEAGRLLRRLHGMDVPGRIGSCTGRRPLRWFLTERASADAAAAARHGLITAEQAASLARQLGEQFRETVDPDRECVLHGDSQPAHFVIAGTGPLANPPKVTDPAGVIAAMLDFGDACTGDPVWDLAVLTLDDPGRLDDVLTGYAPEAGLARRVRRLIQPYRLLRRLGEAVWLQAHGFDAAPGTALLRAAAADPGASEHPGRSGPVIR